MKKFKLTKVIAISLIAASVLALNPISANAVQDDILKDITVIDDEIQTYYNENKDNEFTVGAGATVAHILVANEETAKSLKAKLDAGADFATLAKENSLDKELKIRVVY